VARPSSVLCPSCGSLVGIRDEKCLSCGRLRPGMWGLTPLLRNVGDDMGFVLLVSWVCGALYLACLASDFDGIQKSGLLTFLSPSTPSLFLFGASGAIPVFRYGHWWSVLSAGWLHGGVLHILFNMLWVRDLVPPTAKVYGAGRTVIIYTIAGICGFSASTLAFLIPFLPDFLRSGPFTVGASAPIFGLLGALVYYGRRGGSSYIGQQAKSLAISALLFGFIMHRIGIDNWAHLGGFAGGYVTARVLDPLKPEQGNHVIAAIVCLALSFLAVAISVVKGLAILR
jgi:rhomboid protease GluP